MQGEQGGSKANIANPPAGKDPIAGALQRFGLKHPSRPVGVAKIDLASSFTDASSPAHALSAATSKPATAGEHACLCSLMHSVVLFAVLDNIHVISSRWKFLPLGRTATIRMCFKTTCEPAAAIHHPDAVTVQLCCRCSF